MASKDVWRKRIARWRESGLSKDEFAARLRVSPKSVTYWDWVFRTEATGLASKESTAAVPAGSTATSTAPPDGAAAQAESGATMVPRRGRPPKAKTLAKPTTALGPVRWLQVVGGMGDEPDVAGLGPSPTLELVLVGGRTIRVPRGFDAETLARLITVVEAR